MKKPKTYTEKRPWGMFEQFTLNELSTVKIITVKRKQELSLQYHYKRTEFWRVLAGKPVITIGNKKYRAKAGDEFFIPVRTEHRIAGGTAKETAKILEIASGMFDEEDIIRLEDRYGRAENTKRRL